MLTRTIAIGILLAGALDIVSAFVFAGAVTGVLRTVASGPFGDDIAAGPIASMLGLLTHFALMAVMVIVYVAAAQRIPALNRYWVVAGLLYGVALWLVMYWIVLPLRWASFQTPHEALPIAKQLFSHCICVGLPIAWLTQRHAAGRPGLA